MYSRQEIAQRYGFETFAELLDISQPLPMRPGETARSFLARRPTGTWFIWQDPVAQHPSNAPRVMSDDFNRSGFSQNPLPGHTRKRSGA